jgi:hypothetical protein
MYVVLTSSLQDTPGNRTVNPILRRPLEADRIKSHWAMPEINEWPRAETIEWTDLKRRGIQVKLEALAKRGKGPLAKSTFMIDVTCVLTPQMPIPAAERRRRNRCALIEFIVAVASPG